MGWYRLVKLLLWEWWMLYMVLGGCLWIYLKAPVEVVEETKKVCGFRCGE